jgi:hypothetical protein
VVIGTGAGLVQEPRDEPFARPGLTADEDGWQASAVPAVGELFDDVSQLDEALGVSDQLIQRIGGQQMQRPARGY